MSCRNTVVDLGDVYDETGFLRDMDREGTARDVVGAPANDQCVVSLLRRRVRPVSYTHLTLPTNREV